MSRFWSHIAAMFVMIPDAEFARLHSEVKRRAKEVAEEARANQAVLRRALMHDDPFAALEREMGRRTLGAA